MFNELLTASIGTGWLGMFNACEIPDTFAWVGHWVKG